MGTQEIGINFPEVTENKYQFKSKQQISKNENFGERIRQVIKGIQRRRNNLESDVKLNFRAQRTSELYELLDAIGKDEDTLALAQAKQRVRESIQNVQAEIQEYVSQQIAAEQLPNVEKRKGKSSPKIIKSQLDRKISNLQKEGARKVKSSPVLRCQKPKTAVVSTNDGITRKAASTSDVALAEIFRRDEAYLHHVYGKPLYTGTRFTQKDPYLRLRSSPVKQNVHKPLQRKAPETTYSYEKHQNAKEGITKNFYESKMHAKMSGTTDKPLPEYSDLQSAPKMTVTESSGVILHNDHETVTTNDHHLSAIPLAPPKRTRLTQENIGIISLPSQKITPNALSQSNVAVLNVVAEKKEMKHLIHQKLPSLHIEGKDFPYSFRKNTKLVTFREDDDLPLPKRTFPTDPVLSNVVLEQVYVPSNSSSQPKISLGSPHNPLIQAKEFANQKISELLGEAYIPSYRTEQEFIARVLSEAYPSSTNLAPSTADASPDNSDDVDKDLIKRLVIEVIKENMSHLWRDNVEEQIDIENSIKQPLSSAEEHEMNDKTDSEISNNTKRKTDKEQNDKTSNELSDKTDTKLSDETDAKINERADSKLSDRTDSKLSDKTDTKLSNIDTQLSNNDIAEVSYNPDNISTSINNDINYEIIKNKPEELRNNEQSKLEQTQGINTNFSTVYNTPDVSHSDILEQPPTPSRTPSLEQQILNMPSSPPLSDDEDLQGIQNGIMNDNIVPTPERTPSETPPPVQKVIDTPAPSPPPPTLQADLNALELLPSNEDSYKPKYKDAEVQITPPEPVTESTLSTSVTTSEGIDLLLSEGEIPYRNWGQATLSGVPDINMDHLQNVEETDKSFDVNHLDQNNSLSEGEIPVKFLQKYNRLCTAVHTLQLDKDLCSGKDIKNNTTGPSAVDLSKSLSSSQDFSLPDLSEGQIPEELLASTSKPSLWNRVALAQNPSFIPSHPITSPKETVQSLSEGEIADDVVESIFDMKRKIYAPDRISVYWHTANGQNKIGKLDQRQLDHLKFRPVLSTEMKYPSKCSATPVVIENHPLVERELEDISSSLSEVQ